MQNIRDALLRDVDVCREMLKLHDAMASCGYPENPFWDNFSTAADGIYKLIGEHTETFEESITNLALTAPYLTNERRVEMLMAEYKKNFPIKEPGHVLTTEDIGLPNSNHSQSCSDSYSCTLGRLQDKVTLT